MKTRDEMVAEALAKNESQPSAVPQKVAYVTYGRDELLSVLGAQRPVNDKCRDLLVGVGNAGAGSNCTVVREDLLTALGVDWQSHDEKRRSESQSPNTKAATFAGIAHDEPEQDTELS